MSVLVVDFSRHSIKFAGLWVKRQWRSPGIIAPLTVIGGVREGDAWAAHAARVTGRLSFHPLSGELTWVSN